MEFPCTKVLYSSSLEPVLLNYKRDTKRKYSKFRLPFHLLRNKNIISILHRTHVYLINNTDWLHYSPKRLKSIKNYFLSLNTKWAYFLNVKADFKETTTQNLRKTSGYCFYLIWRLHHPLSKIRKDEIMKKVSLHISENSHIEIYIIQKEILTYYFCLIKSYS